MSYDVTIGQDSFNYTYNVAELFYDHMEHGIGTLDGLSGKDAVDILSSAFDGIHSTYIKEWDRDAIGAPKFCARYDAPNGWGSAVGGLIFLAQILAACARNPLETVRVS